MIYATYRYKSELKQPEVEFQMCKFLVATIFICGLTWLFGFLMLIPAPKEFIYLGFTFALIFCLLNAFQGVFIFIIAVLLKRVELSDVVNMKSYTVTASSTTYKNIEPGNSSRIKMN
jgi:hypothetical protein